MDVEEADALDKADRTIITVRNSCGQKCLTRSLAPPVPVAGPLRWEMQETWRVRERNSKNAQAAARLVEHVPDEESHHS